MNRRRSHRYRRRDRDDNLTQAHPHEANGKRARPVTPPLSSTKPAPDLDPLRHQL
jgi:hypothetical protein